MSPRWMPVSFAVKVTLVGDGTGVGDGVGVGVGDAVGVGVGAGSNSPSCAMWLLVKYVAANTTPAVNRAATVAIIKIALSF